ncbi:MAG: ATP-grasp domain-containing protein [Clostridia bacterium]|nr:ATP-grasp domain-containing protein [Clostridia bacterium]
MIDLSGKRILFLEGENMLIPVLEKAKKYGIYSVIVNMYSTEMNPAKLVADKHYEVNFRDIHAMLEIIEKEKIDGIFTAFTDANIDAFCAICEAADLPCYTTEKLCDVMVNKATFKSFCRKAGVPVIEEYDMNDLKIEEIQFPVIVKPVDNSGARGISVCADASSLPAAVERGLEFSKVKDVVIERYIRAEYALADFIVQNGKCFLVTTVDKPVNDDDKGNVNLPGAYIYPSKHDALIKDALTESVQKFVDLIDYKNGILCLELIVEGDKVYAIEPQFRYGGKFQDVFIEAETGVDEIQLMFDFAVNGKFGDDTLPKQIHADFKRHYVQMNILVDEGTITKVPEEAFVKELITHNGETGLYIPRKTVGTVIKPDGSMIQMYGKITLSADTRQELLDAMRDFQKKMWVLDEKGDNMIIKSMPDSYC